MDYYLLTELFLPSTGLMSTSLNHSSLVLYGKELLDEDHTIISEKLSFAGAVFAISFSPICPKST